jgi:thiol-disulfide isomerase/thioredoxin
MTPDRRLSLLLPLALALAACSSGGGAGVATDAPPAATTQAPSEESAAVPSDGATASTAPSEATPTSPAAPVLDQPWATAELVDVETGSTFRIADLAGRTIILETMAIWCANCLAQQGHAYEALAELDPERVAYVLIDVDPSETGEALKAYRDSHGFTGTYAVATAEVARALAAEFGDQVLNPPATPMILIGSDGTVTLTDFGQKSPAEIVALAQAHGA